MSSLFILSIIFLKNAVLIWYNENKFTNIIILFFDENYLTSGNNNSLTI